MSNYVDEVTVRNWENCPFDILLMIIKQLHTNILSIHICFQINKTWREAVTYYCDRYDLWKSLIDSTIFDKAITVMDHSYSDARYKDVYLNSILWKNIHVANSEISLLETNGIAKHIHIDNDHLIVVFLGKVVVYNINNYEQMEEIHNDYEDFQCKGPLTCIIHKAKPFVLQLRNIYCTCKENGMSIAIPHPKLWSASKTECYFLDINNSIWKYSVENCVQHTSFIARHCEYRCIAESMYVKDEKVYLIQNSRLGIITYSKNQLGVCNIVPIWNRSPMYCALLWFDTEISIYGTSRRYMRHLSFEDHNWSLIVHNISAAVRHGNLILVGHNEGRLDVYEANRCTMRDPIKMVRQFQLDTVPIREILVHEGDKTHTIYALLGCSVSKIYLTYPYIT